MQSRGGGNHSSLSSKSSRLSVAMEAKKGFGKDQPEPDKPNRLMEQLMSKMNPGDMKGYIIIKPEQREIYLTRGMDRLSAVENLPARHLLDAFQLRGTERAVDPPVLPHSLRERSLSIIPDILKSVLQYRSSNPEQSHDWYFEQEEKDLDELRRKALLASDLDHVLKIAKETLMEVMDLHLRITESIVYIKEFDETLHGGDHVDHVGFLESEAMMMDVLRKSKLVPESRWSKDQLAGYDFAKESVRLTKLMKEAEKKLQFDPHVKTMTHLFDYGRMVRVDAVLDVAVERIINSKGPDGFPWAPEYKRLPSHLSEWADRYAYEPSPTLCKRILQAYAVTDLLNPPPTIYFLNSSKNFIATLVGSLIENPWPFSFVDVKRNPAQELPPIRSYYLRTMATALLEDLGKDSRPWLLMLYRMSPVVAMIATIPGKDHLNMAYRAVTLRQAGMDAKSALLVSFVIRGDNVALNTVIQPIDQSLMQLMTDQAPTSNVREMSILAALAQYRCVVSGCRPLAEALFKYCSDKPDVFNNILKEAAAWSLVSRSLLSFDHPRPSALLQQLLLMPFMRSQINEVTSLGGGQKRPLREVLGIAMDRELDLPQPAVGEALELLRLAGSYNEQLPFESFEKVALTCLELQREDLCLSTLKQFFLSSKQSPTAQLVDKMANALVAMTSDSFLVLLQLIPSHLTFQWHSSLLSASARSRAGSIALMLVEALKEAPVSVALCSQLAEAFLMSNQEASDGATAALKALEMIVAAKNSSLVDLSPAAKVAYTSSLLGAPPNSSLDEIRKLAFEISPAAETAIALLSSSEHLPLPPAVIQNIINLSKNGRWRGIGSLALAYINRLSSDQRAASISEGGSSTLAGALLGDAIETGGDSDGILSFVKSESKGWKRDQWRGLIAEAIEFSNASPAHSQLASSLANLSVDVIGQEWTWIETLIRISLFQAGNISLQKPHTIDGAAQPLFSILRNSGWLLDPKKGHEPQIEFLAWLGSSKSLSSSSAAHNQWLMPVLADLCKSLASIGPTWSKALIKTSSGKEAALFAVRACEQEGFHLPIIDILKAFKSREQQLPKGLAIAASEAVVLLEAWDCVDLVLAALDLDLGSWSSEPRVATCIKFLGSSKLPSKSAASLIALLPHCSWSEAILMPRSMALSAVANLLPQLDTPSSSIDKVKAQLRAHREAANAAADLDFAFRTGSEKVKHHIMHHTAEAKKALNKWRTSGDGGVSKDDILSSYESLFEVFDAARRPSEIVRVVLELMEGNGTILDQRELQSLAASAMDMCSGLGFDSGSLLIFQMVLLSHRKLTSQDLMVTSASSDALTAELVNAVGEDVYYTMQEMMEGMEVEEVVAREEWIRSTALTRKKRPWRNELEIEANNFAQNQFKLATEVKKEEIVAEEAVEQDDGGQISKGLEKGTDPRVVVLYGGRAFKDSDRQMLQGLFPNAELRWCGSARYAGTGGVKNLEESIAKGKIDLVYIQTRHNGHDSGKIIDRCKSSGTHYQLLGMVGTKAIMKSESLRKRYSGI